MSAGRGPFDLSGRVALVTGSSRGIGAAIARGLAAFGATVVVHGTRAGSTAATAGAIRDDGGACHEVSGDLAEPEAGIRLVAAAEAAAGPLDILVVNASAQVNGPLEAITPEAFDLQIAVNLRATVDLLAAVLPGMAVRRHGRIVCVGSVNQRTPKPVVTLYAATKAAQHNLVQSLARAHARDGIVINTLAPGLVDTDRNATRRDGDPAGWIAYQETVNWMGRAGRAEEMVGAAVFLASDAASFMTGEALFLTGGG